MSSFRRNHDNSELLFGIIFGGFIILAAHFEWNLKETLIALVVIIFLFALYALILYYTNNKCPHGTFKGTVVRNGKCKCEKCQLEYTQRIQAIEKERQESIRKKELEDCYKKELANAKKIKREMLLSSSSIIASLSPFEFEDYIADLLQKVGFEKIQQTPYRNDGGKDIICYYKDNKYYVECKHYGINNKISRPLMQKLFAAMTEDNVAKGIFITTSSFSTEAIEYGKKHHIRTIDGDELAHIISTYQPQKEYPTNYYLHCPKCGEAVEFEFHGGLTTITCSNGHIVEGVSDIQLFPKRQKVYKGIKFHYRPFKKI